MFSGLILSFTGRSGCDESITEWRNYTVFVDSYSKIDFPQGLFELKTNETKGKLNC